MFVRYEMSTLYSAFLTTTLTTQASYSPVQDTHRIPIMPCAPVMPAVMGIVGD